MPVPGRTGSLATRASRPSWTKKRAAPRLLRLLGPPWFRPGDCQTICCTISCLFLCVPHTRDKARWEKGKSKRGGEEGRNQGHAVFDITYGRYLASYIYLTVCVSTIRSSATRPRGTPGRALKDQDRNSKKPGHSSPSLPPPFPRDQWICMSVGTSRGDSGATAGPRYGRSSATLREGR